MNINSSYYKYRPIYINNLMENFKSYLESKEKRPTNTSKEIKIAHELGSDTTNLVTTSKLISKLLPIVSSAFKDLTKQGRSPQEIEEMLEDGLRQAIIATNAEGQKIGSPKTKMSTAEFIRQAEKRRQDMIPKGDPSDFGQLPDSLEKGREHGPDVWKDL